MSDEERTEDLNPRSEDIEEKVKRMLDPAIPDEPEPATPAAPSKKSIAIQAVSAPAEPEASAPTEDTLPSAPELPAQKPGAPKTPTSKVAVTKKSKKVIIPISHHDEELSPPGVESAGAAVETSGPETAPSVKQITIADHDESTEDVAEKLDEAIAELNTTDTKNEEVANDVESQVEADVSQSDQPEEIEPIEPAENETPISDPAVITDAETDKAVEEIVAAEGDELLEVEDAVRDTDEPVEAAKPSHRNLLQTLKSLWAKPGLRRAATLLVVVSVLVAGVVPASRYFVLNTAGVRATSSLLVLDESTHQPLKNVTVKLGKSSGVTDEEGKVSLQKVKLGTSLLSIEKRAFAPVTKTIIVGWGSNPLGDFSLTPTGSQYSFNVTDFLSGKPLNKIEASSGEASAVSDEKGNIKLTIDRPDDAQFVVSLKADGFRSETVSLDPNDKTSHAVKLVPARKQVFVSKRSGKYDVYSIYIDGKDEQQLLPGSGNEKEGMVLVPHPTDEIVAYVSTRGGQHNKDGFLLSNLILINPADKTTTNIVAAERIQIIDWLGDHLIYVQIAADSSANSPKRYRLMSYNYKDETNKELASSNYFNDVITANGNIYFAPSSAYQNGKTGFYKINPDGSGQQTLFDQEVWNIFRTSYDHFALSVQQQWYDYHLGDKTPTKLNSAPANQTSRVYINSPDITRSVWVDNRDGKGTLLMYDTTNQKDTALQGQSGLGYPVRWLSKNTMVYRVKTDQETADYAISTEGGEPVKIHDVTNSGGIDRWYYY